MNGAQLSDLRAMFKNVVGASQGTSSEDQSFNRLLDSTQRDLAARFDWPVLGTRWTASCSTRFTDLPTTDEAGNTDRTINLQRPLCFERKHSSLWESVDYGIGPEEHEVYDPTDDAVDPITRWQMYGYTKFEVWPTPKTAQTVRITGQRVLSELFSNDNNTADLDDMLIVLFAAAAHLALIESPNAGSVAQRAQTLFNTLRGNQPQYTKECIIGGGWRKQQQEINPVKIIAVA